VATDINHDGEIDLSALSERRGVFIWLNKGKASNGRLKALKRKHHRPGQFSLSSGSPLASAPESSPDGAAATGSEDVRDADQGDCATHDSGLRPGTELPSLIVPPLTDARGGAASSRAPPSAHD